MTKDPNRTTSDEVRARWGEIITEVRDVLVHNGVKPVLSDGTVLGFVREGDFIKWDFDVDFFVDSADVMGKEHNIVKSFKNRGFIIVKVRSGKTDWKVAVEKEDLHIDVRSFYRKGDNFISKVRRSNRKFSVYTMPSKYMDNLQEITFYGEEYFIPEDTDGYLTHLYGDWRTPIRSVRHDEYLSKGFKKVVSK